MERRKMDPLSVTASIIAVLQVTGQLSAQCLKYIQLCRSAHSEPLQIAREIGGLHTILTALKELAERDEPPTASGLHSYESQDHFVFPILRQLCQPGEVLYSCYDKLKKLEKDLEPPLKITLKPGSRRDTILHTLTWPLKDGQVKMVLADINRFTTVFSLALSADTTTSILDIRDKTNKMYSAVQQLQESDKESKKDRQADEILRWLSAPDASADQSDALKRRIDKTGAWFIGRQQYDDWKSGRDSFAWLYGIPGCGKTILTSTVVEDVFRHCASDSKHAVAYFYFKADDASKKTHEGMLRALIKQLFEQGNRESQALKRLSKSQQQPTVSLLLSTLKDMISEFDEIFFILDALDECEERDDLLDDLEQIYQWKTANLHILVTSRDEKEIKEFIEDYIEPLCTTLGKIQISAALVKEDIRAYVRERLRTDKGLKRFRKQPEIQEEIENALTEKAEGMFQWVVCQLKALEKCYSVPELQEALESLPDTLYGTYEQMLCRIGDKHAGVALRIFQWLLFSCRPMRIEELAELAVVDVEKEPPIDTKRRFLDPQDIMNICSGLVTTMSGMIEDDTDEPSILVRLAHISIREYLLSDAIRSGKAARYHIETTSAHTLIAESSLVYMQLFDAPIPDLVKKYPLARYVATYWLHHYEKVPEKKIRAHELAFDFFVRKKTAYMHWLQFFCSSQSGRSIHPDLVGLVSNSPLNIVATFDLLCLLRLMLESAEIDTTNDSILREALRFAYFGHSPPRLSIETTRLLLQHGATFKDDDWFPHTLHAASFFGLDEFVKEQLDKRNERDERVDINIRGGTFDTALQAAVAGRHQRIFEEMAYTKWLDGYPTVSELLEKRDPTTVRLLLEREANPNLVGGRYGCALQAACFNGDLLCAQLLLYHRANPTFVGGREGSVLAAACYSKDIRIVKLLLDSGADANSAYALQNACRTGRIDIVRLLLERGADPNLSGDGESSSPLQLASEWHNTELVNLLIDSGADPNLCQSFRGTALQAAALAYGSVDVAQLLIDRGADVNIVAGKFGTALQAAAQIGDADTVQLLIDKGANVQLQGGFFGSALRAAVNSAHTDVAVALLKHGADLETPGGRYGSTLRETLASVPESKNEVIIELGRRSGPSFCVLKRKGTTFLDFDNITLEERDAQNNETDSDYDCRLPRLE